MSDTTNYADTSLTIRVFNYTINVYIAILWQYAQSTNIFGLINAKNAFYAINVNQFLLNWYNNVFNLETANLFGCVVWALILGIPLNFVLGTQTITGPFGFGPDSSAGTGTATNQNQNFYNANFATTTPQSITFTPSQILIILQLQYRKMTCAPNAPSVNKILNDILVPVYGPMYMQDNYNMSASLMLSSTTIPAFLQFVVSNMDLLPRPIGVSYNIVAA